MKKRPGDIIILHQCTKNHDHIQGDGQGDGWMSGWVPHLKT